MRHHLGFQDFHFHRLLCSSAQPQVELLFGRVQVRDLPTGVEWLNDSHQRGVGRGVEAHISQRPPFVFLHREVEEGMVTRALEGQPSCGIRIQPNS